VRAGGAARQTGWTFFLLLRYCFCRSEQGRQFQSTGQRCTEQVCHVQPPARQAVPIANRANHLTADHTSGWLRFGASPYQIRGRGQRRGRYESPLDGADEDTSEANRAFDL
jgi:hypothetical protein